MDHLRQRALIHFLFSFLTPGGYKESNVPLKRLWVRISAPASFFVTNLPSGRFFTYSNVAEMIICNEGHCRCERYTRIQAIKKGP